MKYKSTEQVLKIIKDKNQIRNFGVIAHVDHGKTTMSDSLLAASGIIAPSAVGEALALDYMKDEQERGITIVQANVTLHFSKDDKEYVINKVDRLIKELRLTPEKMQEQLAALVANFNGLIDTYAEPEFKDKWKVSIQDGSVSLGSAKDKWAINIDLMKEKGISFIKSMLIAHLSLAE